MLTVNAMAVAQRSLPDQLDILTQLPADGIGLSVSSLAHHGWVPAATVVRRFSAQVQYLFTGIEIDVADDDAWRQQREILAEAIRWAHAQQVPMMYLTSGRSGRLLMDHARAEFTRQIAPIVKLAADVGVGLALENTLAGRGEFSFTNSVRDVIRLADQAGIEGLVVDVGCCWQEHDVVELVQQHHDRVRLIQVSDAVIGTRTQPDRRVPGEGDIPLVELLQALAIPQAVWDVELVGPTIEVDPEAALRRALAWLGDHVR